MQWIWQPIVVCKAASQSVGAIAARKLVDVQAIVLVSN